MKVYKCCQHCTHCVDEFFCDVKIVFRELAPAMRDAGIARTYLERGLTPITWIRGEFISAGRCPYFSEMGWFILPCSECLGDKSRGCSRYSWQRNYPPKFDV